MQLENLCIYRRYSEPELGSHNFTVSDITGNEDSIRVWLNDRNGQEPVKHRTDGRVLGQILKHKKNDNSNDNILKDKSVAVIKKSNGTSQEKETRKNKSLGFNNYRDPIQKSWILSRRAYHQVTLKVERQGSC